MLLFASYSVLPPPLSFISSHIERWLRSLASLQIWRIWLNSGTNVLSLTKQCTAGSGPLCSLIIYFINLVIVIFFFITLECKYSLPSYPFNRQEISFSRTRKPFFFQIKLLIDLVPLCPCFCGRVRANFIRTHQQTEVVS